MKPLLSIIVILALCTISCKKDKTDNNNNSNATTVTDIDGNSYKTVTIGTQVWMAENLKVTHYRNGDAIPNITDSAQWSSLTTGAYCIYNNSSGNGTIYGKLYNWYAVNDSRNIAPTGWHVSTDADWATLTTALGGDQVAGGKLKETGLNHWQNPNISATNEVGFTAIPGGTRNFNGAFNDIGHYSYWWSFTANNTSGNDYDRSINNNSGLLYRNSNKEGVGYSVRCVKD